MLTVTAAVLLSIAVTPANPSIAKGTTAAVHGHRHVLRQLDAGPDQPGDLGLGHDLAWPPSPRAGLATGWRTGTSTISATLGGVSGSTVLTVTAAVLAVDRRDARPIPTIAKGTTQQFTATGTYSDSSTQDLTSQVTWASATTSVATITSRRAWRRGWRTGTSTISATLGGISGSTVLTVTAAVLESIAVTPANPSIAEGRRSSSPRPAPTPTARRRT